METRVKERLVGAVILVALIVALVPEILSGPRQSTDAGSAADSEQPLRTYTIDLEERGFAEETASGSSTPTPPDTLPEQTEPAPANPVSSQDAPEAPSPTPAAPVPVVQARPEPPADEPASTSGWAVQVGSFSNAENAQRLARDLRARGFKAFVSPHESDGQKRMRVRVGPEQDRARAEQLAKRLRRDGRQVAVVAHP